ncbi:hypothetical protein [Enterovirga sp.]|uniref:hypothetical protein n=1 Tax=Enterovirga sp. TaxID=2026350 RepID=UPI002BFA2E66|nr:hypothetical protein [Enterovirga sp.]HMO30773.1 hypothetical protein [Enterovirga sp.]
MIRAALGGLLFLAATGAFAQEAGCGRLAWNLDAERALLASDGTEQAAPPLARRLGLRPMAEAALPKPPERAPRAPQSFAAFTTVSIPEAGLYRVTLDSDGWLDVIQDGAYRGADAFTGARACPGLRKSVRFRLEPGEAIVQVNRDSGGAIGIAVTREP